MSNIGDDWSDQQHKSTEDVDFDASGTTPPRPVKWEDDDAGPPPEPVQHQPPPSDHSGSNQQTNQQTSQQTPTDNSQGNIVHVSHMHVGVDDQLLTEHMSSSGKVNRVVIMLDPHTKESRGFGFVTFESASDADDAIEKLHLSQILGKTITVARARRGRPRDPTPGHYIGPPKYDRSMSSNGRPSKPRYQPYPSRDIGDSRDMRVARDYGYDRYERGPPRYAGRYHPYPDRDDRYGPLPPPRDYRDYSPPRDYYRGGPAPYRPYPRDGPPPSRREPPRDRYDDRPPRDSFARGPPRDYARDYPPRDDFDRPPRRFAPRGDFRDGYRDDMRGGPPRDYDRGYSRY